MAKPKFSGIGVVDINASINNTTFSRNAYGTYSKVRIGAPAGSPFLTAWQMVQSSLNDDWQNTLTDAERSEWVNWEKKMKNRMAVYNRITGYQAFMSVNSNRSLIGQGVTILPPVYSPVAQCDEPFVALALPNTIILSANLTDYSTSSLAVYMTFPLSLGQMSVNQRYGYINFTTGSALNTTYAQYATRFGVSPAGSKVFFKCVPINKITGARGVSKFTSFIFP